MEKGDRLQFFIGGEVLEACICQLDAIGAYPFQLGETGQQGQRAVGDGFAADREVFDRGEAAERFEVGLSEGVTLHIHLRNDSGGLRDLGTELLQVHKIGCGELYR